MKTQNVLALIQKSRDKQTFLNNLTVEEIKTLRSIIKKILNGELPVAKTHVKKLATYKKPIRKIAHIDSKNVQGLRRALRQTGYGLFTILLPAALSLLSGLITKK